MFWNKPYNEFSFPSGEHSLRNEIKKANEQAKKLREKNNSTEYGITLKFDDEDEEDNEDDNESIIEQVKCINLSGYSADAEYNEELINKTIKRLHRLNDFKRIKQIHFINQLGDHSGAHGLQCIIEYEIADAHILWD